LGQGQTLADLAGAALAQHGAHIAFALEVAKRGARLMPSRQQLEQTMGADKSRAPGDQNARHC
jgi:hypothetical protein